jgi:hypothetical protein
VKTPPHTHTEDGFYENRIEKVESQEKWSDDGMFMFTLMYCVFSFRCIVCVDSEFQLLTLEMNLNPSVRDDVF